MTTPTTPSDDLEAAAKPWPLIGYAPGGYMCRCTDCNTEFTGDKRAVHCVTCAAKVANGLLSERLADKAEIETLRLAICGGEDAPGYAASLPLEAILGVAANNAWSWRDASDRALSAEAAQARAEETLADWRESVIEGREFHGLPNDIGDHPGTVIDRLGGERDRALAALRASQEALRDVEAMLDRYNAPTTDDGDGSLLSLANRIEAKVYADAVAAAKFVADVRIIEPHLDAVICYASDINEHPPNGAVMRIRQTLAQVEGGGEDKGSIPGPVTDDLRASRGEGSGS